MIVRCTECGAEFEAGALTTSDAVPCPECGTFITGGDVPAVVEAEEAQADRIGPDPRRSRTIFEAFGPDGQRRVYDFEMLRTNSSGNGCCLLGCLVIFAILALAVRGCFDLLGG